MNILYDKEENIYLMSLSELKTTLYSDKKLSKESKQIIKNIINDKINKSFKQINNKQINNNQINNKQINNNQINNKQINNNQVNLATNHMHIVNDFLTRNPINLEKKQQDPFIGFNSNRAFPKTPRRFMNNNNTDDDSDSDSNDSDYDNKDTNNFIFQDNKNKLYKKADKKGENEKITQTSKKIFDRMVGEAMVINSTYTNNMTNTISRPYSTLANNYDDSSNNLGVRRNIKK
jgi:hypothetical protein